MTKLELIGRMAAAAGIIIAVISIFFGFLNFKLTRGGKADA